NQMSAFWFERLKGVVRNHVISTDDSEIAARVGHKLPDLYGPTTLAKKAKPLPIECVVRGYLAGSFTKEYRNTAGEQGAELHG
ncbi:phosphoribosylaminoimidazolesuccinocarboxamide synthase, partial [Salmonella enterica]|uniref:phosphoribosylaminoimidazolesuccinocarboxamide synthase n=1 Tax=Salmonella enterica TaxID=28901 RepID=UPI0032B39E8B